MTLCIIMAVFILITETFVCYEASVQMSADILGKANTVLLISSVHPRESPLIVLRDKTLNMLAFLSH